MRSSLCHARSHLLPYKVEPAPCEVEPVICKAKPATMCKAVSIEVCELVVVRVGVGPLGVGSALGVVDDSLCSGCKFTFSHCHNLLCFALGVCRSVREFVWVTGKSGHDY